MPQPGVCSKCGAPLPAEGPCPQCLMQFGLDLPDHTVSVAPIDLTEKPGDRIGHYKLLQQIGEGGCGIVYMAEQEEPVRRRVALKIIKLGMDTRNVIARFEAERQALALMDHPNIAKVLDAGATQTGRPFFVMELVRGVKITGYCDQQQLATRQRLELFIPVCQAIQHAHQKGVIHRDIKPSNILVTEHDGAAVPKIIDFGIAKATTGQPLTDKTLFTAFEQFLGTPAYMSPEQAGLGGLDVDTRSDIYSLGVLLYELLTGQPPFDATQLRLSALDEIVRIIREQEPPRPSARLTTLTEQELTTIAQHRQIESAKLPNLVRGDLDWIVMKALEKDRTRRYETANGLAMDLQRHLTNEPVVARPQSNLYRLQKLVRRNKLAFTAGAAVTLALMLGLGLSTWLFLKERQARRRAVAAERTQTRLRQEADSARHQAESDKQTATTEANKSQQVAQLLRDMLKGVGPAVALGRDTTILKEILEKTAERLGKELTNQPAVEADLRQTLGGVYLELGEYPKAEAMFSETLALRKKLFGDEDRDIATVLTDLGSALDYQDKSAEAEVLHHQALAMSRKLLGNDHIHVATALNQLVVCLAGQGKYTEAEPLQREALAIERKAYGNEHLEVAASLNNFARVLDSNGKFAEAEAAYREVLEIHKKLLPGDHPTVAASLMNLAAALENQGHDTEAETYYREALRMERKLLGNEHPALGNFLRNLAGLLDRQGKRAEAEDLYGEALAISAKALGDQHPKALLSRNNLAMCLADHGKYVEAEALLRQQLDIEKRVYGAEHPDIAFSLHNLATVLERQGKNADAELLHREALGMRKKLLGAEHPDYTVSLNALLRVLSKQHKGADAEEFCREALALAPKAAKNDPSKFGMLMPNLAENLYRLGKYAEADQLFAEVLPPAAEIQPKHVTLLRTRGGFRARRARFAEAGADLARAIELKPDDHLAWHSLAALLVQEGTLDAYCEHCRKSLDRFANATDPATAHRIAKDCLILPDSGVDLGTVERMADFSVAANTNNLAFMSAKGLADYRQGNFKNAVDWSERVLARSSEAEGDGAWVLVHSYAVLAMAQCQLRQIDQSRATLSKGLEVAGPRLPKLNSGDLGGGWLDWIIAQALLNEATGLIEGPHRR